MEVVRSTIIWWTYCALRWREVDCAAGMVWKVSMDAFYAFWNLLQLTWIRADYSSRVLSMWASLKGCRPWVCEYLKDKIWGRVSQKPTCTLFPLFFLRHYFSSTQYSFNVVSSAFCLFFPFLRGWSRPATTRSWILKLRRLLGSVSAKRKRSGEWLSPSLSSVQPIEPTRCPLIFHALYHLPRFIAVALTVGLSAALQSPTISAGCLSFLLHNEFVYREENNH